MNDLLRVLLVDDSPDDVELLVHELRRGGYQTEERRVETAKAMREALSSQTWDLILCDYRLPRFSGPKALEVFKESEYDIPFIIVSGVIDMREAVAVMQSGADDFVDKGEKSRLIPAVQRELREAQNRHLKRKAQKALKEANVTLEKQVQERTRKLQETVLQLEAEVVRRKAVELDILELLQRNKLILNSAGEGIYGLDLTGCITFLNPAAAKMIGWKVEELNGLPLHDVLYHHRPDGSYFPAEACPIYSTFKDGEVHHVVDEVFWRKDGTCFPVEYTSTPIRENGGRVLGAVVVYRDISERKRVEEALVAKERAEASNQAKSAFLASMSHEIRTPMNAILGMGELLQETQLTKTQEWCVETLNRSGEMLLDLINDILDLSKIEAEQLKLEEIAFDLRQLVHDIIGLFEFTINTITLEHRIDKGVSHWVLGDPARLRQVLINLIGNALKFTKKGQVIVNVESGAGDHVSFTVVDTGPGIALEKQQEIFQPFTQAHISTTRKYGGTGLGLPICQRLVKLMGGCIELESELGKGSSFTFAIPLSPVEAEVIFGENGDKSKIAALPRAQEMALSKRTLNILLVDDAEDNRLLVQAFLKKTPHQLVMVENGVDAVDKFKTQRFDLILMDIQMPLMDGYEATRKIRAWEKKTGTESTPIIALTAYAMAEESAKIKDAGCDLHLTKPIKKKRLLDTINQLINCP